MQAGNVVSHPGFGFGTITEVKGSEISVNFSDSGIQKVNKGTLTQSINS